MAVAVAYLVALLLLPFALYFIFAALRVYLGTGETMPTPAASSASRPDSNRAANS